MHGRRSIRTSLVAATLSVSLSLVACGTATEPTGAATGAAAPAQSQAPEWFGLTMTDVRTGQHFTIQDFHGKVVLLETMAVWCPTCRAQQDEVKRLHDLVGDRSDLVSISVDVDMGEDAATLKDYATTLGYGWHVAVAPLLVARALGNLYSAEYLDPPASPMLFVDRSGAVYTLPYGLKKAEALQETLAPYLGS